jgi:hypothetical protein
MRGAQTCPDAILGELDREPGGVAKSGRNALDSKSSCRRKNPARGFESHPLRHLFSDRDLRAALSDFDALNLARLSLRSTARSGISRAAVPTLSRD